MLPSCIEKDDVKLRALYDGIPKRVLFDICFQHAAQFCAVGWDSIGAAVANPHAPGSITEHIATAARPWE